jgi:hypothetical protein
MLILINFIHGPFQFGIHDEFVPNKVLEFSFMPLGVAKHLIISPNPDGPKCDAMEEMLN